MGPEGASKEQGPKQVTDRPASHQPATPPQNLPWSEQGGSQLRPLTCRNPPFPGMLIPFVVQAVETSVHSLQTPSLISVCMDGHYVCLYSPVDEHALQCLCQGPKNQ